MTTVFRPLSALLPLALALAACTTGGATGSPGAHGAGPSGEPALPVSVTLTLSGGFAGVHQALTVHPDGGAEVAVRGSARPARELSPAELAEVARLVARVDFATLPGRSIDKNVRDGLEHRVEFDGHVLVTDQFTDLGPADDLIGVLRTHLRARL